MVRRIRLVRLLLVLALVALVARLVDVQVLRAGAYASEARHELTQTVTVPALRGAITDRSGVVLATSVPTDLVVADDFQITRPRHEAKALAPLVHLSPDALAPKLSEHSGYVPIVDHLSATAAKRLGALALPGITLLADSVRVDPAGQLASPVLGIVNGAGTGAAGLEYEYNARLAGKPGRETLLESPSGVQLPGTPVRQQSAAVSGTGLELTLDVPLQYTVESDLAKEIVASHATSGIAIVENVHTGQILAMANLVASTSVSSPAASGTTTATASSVSSAPAVTIGPTGPVQEAPSNLATDALYEPGSVFKIVPFSAALSDGVVTPTTVLTVPGQIQLDGSTISDDTVHPNQKMTVTQILAQSSNVGTTEIAEQLGETRLLDQVKQLGFSGPALNFPGTSRSLLLGQTQWEPTDYASLSIGQVDAVTPLQVLDAYSAVANGGTLVDPSLVKATVQADGSVSPVATPSSRRIMTSATASTLTGMLEQVVDAGTGVAAAVPGYLVAGKTGTAQIPADNGQAGYVTGAYNATFVGFAPADNPVLSAIVVLSHPEPIYGGAVAAPVFSQVMSYALHRYDVPTSPGLGGRPQVLAPSTVQQLVREAT